MHALQYITGRFGEEALQNCRGRGLFEVALASPTPTATIQFLKARNVKWENPEKLVEIAARRGHTAAVALLLEDDAVKNIQKIKDRALRIALSSGHEELVHLLLWKGADPTTSSEQPPALHAAVKSGKVSLVRHLIEKEGCAVGRRDAEGRTALDVARKKSRGVSRMWLGKRVGVYRGCGSEKE